MKFGEFKNAKTLSLASLLCEQNPQLAERIKQNEFLYISCFEDKILGTENLVRCEIGSASYVLALLCKYSLDASKFDEQTREYFEGLDEGYLSGECNVGEEEFEQIAEFLNGCENIVIDSSFLAHADAKNIFEFLQMLGKNVVLSDAEQGEFKTDGELSPLKEPESFDGSVVFFMDEADGLNLSGEVKELIGSASFAAAAKVKDGDMVSVQAKGVEAKAKFKLEPQMKGTVALCRAKFSGYAFKLAKISKIIE